MREHPNNATPLEQKFWTKVKTYFTTLEEDEAVDQQELIWIYLVVLAASIAIIAGAFGMISNLLG